MNLDPNDPVTREHVGKVLMTLQNQLAAFVASNPNHRSTRRMKMLAMAARALLNQYPWPPCLWVQSDVVYKILYVLFKDYFYLKAIFVKILFKKIALYI